jgi:hypothetical protein
MSWTRAFHRPWAYVTVPAVVAACVVGVIAMQGLAILPVNSRLERLGEFTVGYDTYDAFGHRGTRRTLYYHGGSRGRGRLVARSIGTFAVNPFNRHSLLYDRCPSEGSPQCGIHYFDGKGGRHWRVSEERVLNQPVDQPFSWSADGRFLILASEFTLRVVNLEAATTTNMNAALGLEEGHRRVRVGEWSNDQRKIAVLIAEYLDRPPPRVAEDLIVIDVHDQSVTYVATSLPRGWSRARFGWQYPTGNVIWAAGDEDGPDGTIYRKRASELPNGMRVLVR